MAEIALIAPGIIAALTVLLLRAIDIKISLTYTILVALFSFIAVNLIYMVIFEPLAFGPFFGVTQIGSVIIAIFSAFAVRPLNGK